MSHRALYDRSPFLAGILSVLDLFGQAYRNEPAYPHASEEDALSEDWRNILSDGQLAVYRTRVDMDRGALPTQLRLDDDEMTEAEVGKEYA